MYNSMIFVVQNKRYSWFYFAFDISFTHHVIQQFLGTALLSQQFLQVFHNRLDYLVVVQLGLPSPDAVFLKLVRKQLIVHTQTEVMFNQNMGGFVLLSRLQITNSLYLTNIFMTLYFQSCSLERHIMLNMHNSKRQLGCWHIHPMQNFF